MQRCHTRAATLAVFDDPNLMSAAGLVPVLALADAAGLRALTDEHLSVPGDKGANGGLKVASLVAGMVAGADSIDDMALLRHGRMGRVFDRAYAPSTLGSFLRSFTFGHVRQLDAVASRFLTGLAAAGGQAAQVVGDGTGARVLVDIDDTIIEVHGYAKQGAGFGYSGVRGLNALLATATTAGCGPLIVAQRLRKGSCGFPARREAAGRGRAQDRGHAACRSRQAAAAGGLGVLRGAHRRRRGPRRGPGVGHRTPGPQGQGRDRHHRRGRVDPIEYADAIFDEVSGTWVSRAEVAEVPFTAFSSKKATDQVPGRLVVRRIPDLNPRGKDGQDALFDTWRFHAFFTTTDPADLDTVAAHKTHRGHAIIEQVHADLKSSALAHLPSGKFTANDPASSAVRPAAERGCARPDCSTPVAQHPVLAGTAIQGIPAVRR